MRKLVAVLRGDDHGIHARRAAVNIFDRDLGFAVGAEEINHVLLANFGKLVRQAVRQLDRHGHQLGRLVAGEAEHQALVAGAAGIHAHGDVRRLLLDRADHAAGFGVESIFRAGVADVADHLASDVGKSHVSRGGDFAGDHDQAGGDQRFAGDAAHGVVRQHGVQHGIGNLVGNFIGMALGDRLRGKQELLIGMRQNSILQGI